jgi:uncharacterized protein YdeI (YjbR/CyaY-like superfamily)
MAKTDPRIDAYIENAAPFAQPILGAMRALVHTALPEAEETIKWGFPHFMVNGKNICGLAAFKAHCAFAIHGEGRQGEKAGAGLGQYGKIASLTDLPLETELTAKLQGARDRILATGSALKQKPQRKPKPEMSMPDDFAALLSASPDAQQFYSGFPPSARREYLEWITEAKTAPTRQKRILQAVEWITEGKRRNWKYQDC